MPGQDFGLESADERPRELGGWGGAGRFAGARVIWSTFSSKPEKSSAERVLEKYELGEVIPWPFFCRVLPSSALPSVLAFPFWTGVGLALFIFLSHTA